MQLTPHTPRPIHRVLDWLRAAYPGGIPRADVPAVLGVLEPHLTDEDVDAVVAAFEDHEGAPITQDEIRRMLTERHFDNATAEDVARVRARLASGGWPLARIAPDGSAPEGDDEADDPETAGRLARIVSWVREGYPSGVPAPDYQPLLALLRRRLTDKEVKKVSKALRKASIEPVGPEDVEAEIRRLTDSPPRSQDVKRVHDHLAKKGWPVDFPDPD